MQQTFPAGQHISIADVTGDLKIRGWDQQIISVISAENSATMQSKGDIVEISHCKDLLELAVPYEQIVTAKSIDGDVFVENVQKVELEEVRGNVLLKAIAGEVKLGQIGGNVELKGIRGRLDGGSVGGNVFLEASYPPESVTRLRAGGNVHLVLPSDANLTIQATVAGIVHSSAAVSARGNHITLVYGNGAARLEISAGGNLELYGDQVPKSTSTFSGNWQGFTHGWQNQRQSTNTEFDASFTDRLRHTAEKQQRKAEKFRQKAERQAKHPHEPASHMNIHNSNHQRHMEPQHIDRIVAEAYEVAARETQGAIEAVEQALQHVYVTPPLPPRRPKSPNPPSSGPSKPPMPSHDVGRDVNAERQDGPPKPGERPASAIDPTGKSGTNLEQERIAILRMVADGRITPEEGDLLLEAL